MSKTRRVRLSPNTPLYWARWRLAARFQVFEKMYFDFYFPAIGENRAFQFTMRRTRFASPRGDAKQRTRGPSGDQSVRCGGFRVQRPFILRSRPRAKARISEWPRRGRAASRRTRRIAVLFHNSRRDIFRPADKDIRIAALDDRAFHQRRMRGHQRNGLRFGQSRLVGVSEPSPCR